MLQDFWVGAVQIGQDAIPTALGMAAMSLALARAHLQTIEAMMLAAALLLIAMML